MHFILLGFQEPITTSPPDSHSTGGLLVSVRCASAMSLQAHFVLCGHPSSRPALHHCPESSSLTFLLGMSLAPEWSPLCPTSHDFFLGFLSSGGTNHLVASAKEHTEVNCLKHWQCLYFNPYSWVLGWVKSWFLDRKYSSIRILRVWLHSWLLRQKMAFLIPDPWFPIFTFWGLLSYSLAIPKFHQNVSWGHSFPILWVGHLVGPLNLNTLPLNSSKILLFFLW